MKPRANDALWIGTAFGAALLVALVILCLRGATGGSVSLALAMTARIGFLLFWPAYAAGALVVLFGQAFQPLKTVARELGLAFVGVLTVHLSLVGLLCVVAKAPAAGVFEFFGGAAACAYLLAIFSFDPFRRMLGAAQWRLLSFVAMNYLAYAFFKDFTNPQLFQNFKMTLFYLPFLLLAIAGPSLRLTAFVVRLAHDRLELHRRKT
jgi:hypothetical protein